MFSPYWVSVSSFPNEISFFCSIPTWCDSLTLWYLRVYGIHSILFFVQIVDVNVSKAFLKGDHYSGFLRGDYSLSCVSSHSRKPRSGILIDSWHIRVWLTNCEYLKTFICFLDLCSMFNFQLHYGNEFLLSMTLEASAAGMINLISYW